MPILITHTIVVIILVLYYARHHTSSRSDSYRKYHFIRAVGDVRNIYKNIITKGNKTARPGLTYLGNA